VSWFRARLDLEPLRALLRRKPVPVHRHSWIYALGDAAVFLFAFQVATGGLLMLYYQPAQDSAHESVRRIMTEVPYGWLIRSIHAWGASALVGVVWLHLVTVLFARAYRRPRELVWVSGVLMLFVVMGSGFSGYLLPWNELSYCATRVGTEIPGKLPGVGPLVVRFLRGGDQLTGETITRFFAAHVMLAPVSVVLLLSIHTLLARVRGVSLPDGVSHRDVKDRRPFFSEFLLIDVCIWLVLFGAIVSLAVFWPAAVSVKADPLKPAPVGIKPEWYFLFAFQTLKLVPETVGVALFALAAVFLLVLPFLDRNPAGAKNRGGWTVVFAALLACVLVLEILGLASPGVKHPREDLAPETFRVAESAVSLALLWLAIAFLLYYLRRLLNENARVRRLYASDRNEEAPASAT
jgi:cytochrome b6